jgi:hypothetical protein
MKKRMIMLTFLLLSFPMLAKAGFIRPFDLGKCKEAGPFLILEDQSYALCATASCFSFNQLVYCKCDLLKGDSISESFEYNGNKKNICTLNQQGQKNGFRASTFSFPEDVEYPNGKQALYTCPGELNNDVQGGSEVAIGSYGQCDGGICFTSTRWHTFPGFFRRLKINEIICSCPIATNCERLTSDSLGYQISGPYPGECKVESCEKCNAAAVTNCEVPNPLIEIGIQKDIPVGAPTGIPELLACLLLDGNVPDANSCLCQCTEADFNGICTNWTVYDQSPLIATCPPPP